MRNLPIMSSFIGRIFKNSLFSNLRVISCRNLHNTQVKYLYSPSALGIDGYYQTRKRSKEQFANLTDKFRAKMNDFTSDSKNMIFTEDLKNMVHLAEPTDLELVMKMIRKFNSQQSEFRFGSYVFGPVVMRMFHFFDSPKEACECFLDPINDGFFDQLISYQILLDLLYTHEMYDEMHQVYEKIQLKQINMTKFPKYVMVLILAACYKQNTPASLQYASKLWSDMASAGIIPLRRACAYFAALALRQGAPEIALESISGQKQHYVTIRNIKVLALTDMGRVDDALPVLRTVLDVDKPTLMNKNTFFEETIEKVKEAVSKSNNKDLQKEFNDVSRALRDRELIDRKTLDEQLNIDIVIFRNQDQSRTSLFPNKNMPFGQRHKLNKNLV